MFRTRNLALLSLLLLLLLLPLATFPAAGTHEEGHRYYVSGRVTHPDGSPACRVPVLIIPVGRASAEGETDTEGRYRILLHLHDSTVAGEASDEGITIEVSVPEADPKTTTATPGPAPDGWGESVVDFRVPADVGGSCQSPLVQTALFVGVPGVLLLGFAFAYVKVLRPWMVRRSVAPTLTSLTGIGRARQEELRSIGIESLRDLADATPARVANGTSIGKKEARRLIRKARERLAEGEG